VLEPLALKEQTVKSAVEVASMILRIDDVIASARTPTPLASEFIIGFFIKGLYI
jgi:chaperonin GroEL (HSP60 family)